MPEETGVPDDLLTPQEAALLLRSSVRTLQRWRTETGSGPPYIRIGRKVWYSRRVVLNWMQKQQRTP